MTQLRIHDEGRYKKSRVDLTHISRIFLTPITLTEAITRVVKRRKCDNQYKYSNNDMVKKKMVSCGIYNMRILLLCLF